MDVHGRSFIARIRTKFFYLKKMLVLNAKISKNKLQKIIPSHTKQKWIYFGRDIANYYRIGTVLNVHHENINAGEWINRIAREIRDEFVNFDTALCERDKHSLLWQASALAERNPYSSDFFFYCCALKTVQQLRQREGERLIVVCEDFSFGRILTGQTGAVYRGCIPVWMHWGGTLINRTARAVLQRIWFLILMVQRKWILSRYKNTGLPEVPETILTVWADSQTLQQEGSVYFGQMAPMIKDIKGSLGYLCCPLSWRESYSKIVRQAKASGEWSVFPEEMLKFRDILRIIFTTLFFDVKPAGPVRVAGMDVTRFFRDRLRQEKTKSAHMMSLRYYFAGAYFKEKKRFPKRVIHLYENQAWEKCLRIGLKEASGALEIVGCQHAPFPPLYLNYFPSRFDMANRQIPDRIVTIGQCHKQIFKNHGYPDEVLREGVAFRYAYLFGEKDFLKQPHQSFRTVLAATSIDYWESFELVYKAVDYFKDKPDFRLMIKFHPQCVKAPKILSSILKYLDLEQLPSHIEIRKDDIYPLLQETDILLYTFTAVSYEAVAQSKPVVFIQSDIWFDMDKLEWFKELDRQARNAADLDAVFKRLSVSGGGEEDKVYSSRDILKESFEQPTKERILEAYC